MFVAYVVCNLLIAMPSYLLCWLGCLTFTDVGKILDNTGFLLKIVSYSSANVPGSSYLIMSCGKGG